MRPLRPPRRSSTTATAPGSNLGALLCHFCNIAAQTPIPVLFHNGGGYDFHFLRATLPQWALLLAEPREELGKDSDNKGTESDQEGSNSESERPMSMAKAAPKAAPKGRAKTAPRPLTGYYTFLQVNALLEDCNLLRLGASGRAVGKTTHGKRAEHADAGRRCRRAAGLPDGLGPGCFYNQPNYGGVPLSRQPEHGNGLKHPPLPHRTSERFWLASLELRRQPWPLELGSLFRGGFPNGLYST